jgi:hypothetical protein
MRMGWSVVPAALVVLFGSGCHSAYVDAVVTNQTGEPVSLVEVDYPSASFGANVLAPGQEIHYRFKIQGSGKLKAIWTDQKRQEHTVDGPELIEGAEGKYHIVIRGNGVDWQSGLNK